MSPPRKRISKRLAAAAGGRTTSNPSNPSNPLGKVFVVHDQLRRGTVCYLMAKGMEYKCTVKTLDKWMPRGATSRGRRGQAVLRVAA